MNPRRKQNLKKKGCYVSFVLSIVGLNILTAALTATPSGVSFPVSSHCKIYIERNYSVRAFPLLVFFVW